MEAGIEQATVAMRCPGANSPEPRRRAVPGSDTSAIRAEDQHLYNHTWVIVGPCPSEESLCCPACPPPPLFPQILGPGL